MFDVIKRDGEIAEFQLNKITEAIRKAFEKQTEAVYAGYVRRCGFCVTADFQKKIEIYEISVEAIQDSVENVLIQCGYSEVAKAYILYRKQREKSPQYEIYHFGL